MEIIDLEMIPGGPKKTCHASQFDNGRVIRFNLKENGQPFALSGTETVQAIIRKPDGTEKTLDITNTGSTYVDLITAEDTCDLAGVNHCEMKVTEDGEDLGSGNFDMKVEEDAYGAGDVSVGTASGPIASFETNMADVLQEVKCEINATGGNGTPDNPNPIVGYSSANITRCGVNLFDISNINDTHGYNTLSINGDEITITWVNGATVFDTKNKQIFKAGNYIIKGFGTNINKVRAYFYKVSDNTQLTNIYINTETVITLTADFYIAIGGRYDDLDTATFTLQLEVGSTAHDYSPYNGSTVTIAFGQTVYAGVLDVTRGKLHVTHGYADLGTLNYTYYSGLLRFAYRLDDGKPSGTAFGLDTALCECYPVSSVQYSNMPDDSIMVGSNFFSGSVGSIVIHDESYTSVPAIQTALSGQIVVYELATPFDIDLTPVQIEQLLGKNNVYHNANGDTAVKFYIRA